MFGKKSQSSQKKPSRPGDHKPQISMAGVRDRARVALVRVQSIVSTSGSAKQLKGVPDKVINTQFVPNMEVEVTHRDTITVAGRLYI